MLEGLRRRDDMPKLRSGCAPKCYITCETTADCKPSDTGSCETSAKGSNRCSHAPTKSLERNQAHATHWQVFSLPHRSLTPLPVVTLGDGAVT